MFVHQYIKYKVKQHMSLSSATIIHFLTVLTNGKLLFFLSNLDTQLWYLDDGVLIGEAEEVRKALDVFSDVGSRCGLFLKRNCREN